LTFALVTAAGRIAGDANDNKTKALVIQGYNNALERLTSRHTKETDARNISSYWVDFWKQNEDDLRAKDAELRGNDAEPVRPAVCSPTPSINRRRQNYE